MTLSRQFCGKSDKHQQHLTAKTLKKHQDKQFSFMLRNSKEKSASPLEMNLVEWNVGYLVGNVKQEYKFGDRTCSNVLKSRAVTSDIHIRKSVFKIHTWDFCK